jgi:integrase
MSKQQRKHGDVVLPDNIKWHNHANKYCIFKTINGILKSEYVKPPEGLTARQTTKWLEAKKTEIISLWTGNYTKPLSFGEVLEMYLADTSNKRISDETRGVYNGQRERLIKAIGSKQIDRLTCYDIQGYIDSLTVGAAENNAFIIASVLQYARKRKMQGVEPDIIKDVVIPARVDKAKDIYNAAEVKQILQGLAGYINPNIGAYAVTQLRLFVEMAFQSGMRTGELLGLSWHDVNLDDKTVYIHQQLIKPIAKPSYIKPKTKNGKERTINVPDRVINLLTEYRDVERKYRKQNGFKDNDMIFIDKETGGLIQRCSVANWFKGFCKYNKIRFLSPHSFRHYYATNLLDNGVTIATVAKVLGDEVSTVLKAYIKSEAGAEIKACDTISAVIEKALQSGINQSKNQVNGVKMGYSIDQNTLQTAV